MSDRESEARDEVRSLARREGKTWENLPRDVQDSLLSTAEANADDGDDPYDAARDAWRKMQREGRL